MTSSKQKLNQRGQGMAGVFIGLFALLLIGLSMGRHLLRMNREEPRYQSRQLALEVARSGFSDAHAFFRRQSGGVYLKVSPVASLAPEADPSKWPMWPDSAFQPDGGDTLYYENLSDSAGVARAIVREFPLSLTGPAESSLARRWGRSVVKRQIVRNWSPGDNSESKNTVNDACHDLTHMRTDSLPGSGNIWSITSVGYVYSAPGPVSDPAACQLGRIDERPLDQYQGKPFLLAAARVYGEIVRLDYSLPSCALYIPRASDVTLSGKCVINGTSKVAIVRNDAGTVSASNVTTQLQSSNAKYQTIPQAPTVTSVFPGFTLKDISNLADYVGDMSVLPDPNLAEYRDRVSRPTIIVLNGNIVLPADSSRVLTGVGLCVVNGNLNIQEGNLSSWAGLLMVLGDANILGPGDVSGTLVVTGKLSMGGSKYAATVEYNEAALNTLQTLLLDYRVNRASVVTSRD